MIDAACRAPFRFRKTAGLEWYLEATINDGKDGRSPRSIHHDINLVAGAAFCKVSRVVFGSQLPASSASRAMTAVDR